MRWARKVHNHEWRYWFAWRPVRVDNTYAWLEWIDRRHHCGQEICYFEFQLPNPARSLLAIGTPLRARCERMRAMLTGAPR